MNTHPSVKLELKTNSFDNMHLKSIQNDSYFVQAPVC